MEIVYFVLFLTLFEGFDMVNFVYDFSVIFH